MRAPVYTMESCCDGRRVAVLRDGIVLFMADDRAAAEYRLSLVVKQPDSWPAAGLRSLYRRPYV